MKLALIADLHFGSVPEGLSQLLSDALASEAPDLIVIAGDLTLRARKHEFQQAAEWLQSLPADTLLVPGNHDLPFLNVVRRFTDPFGHYLKVPGADSLMPVVSKRNGFVLGFNTTRSWQPHLSWQEGVARARDLELAVQKLSQAPDGCFKAVVTHHPLVKVPHLPRATPALKAEAALQAFSRSGVDLIMSGHTHRSFALQVEMGGQAIAAIGAPTALSSRLRGEGNGFWIIETNREEIRCVRWLRKRRQPFRPAEEMVFRRNCFSKPS